MEERKLVPIWLVWEWKVERFGNQSVWIPALRSVDTEESNAKKHKMALEHEANTFSEDREVVIEKVVLDHLFGYQDWKTFQKKDPNFPLIH